MPQKENGKSLQRDHLRGKTNRRSIFLKLSVFTLALAIIISIGRHASGEIQTLQQWTAGHGLTGQFVFLLSVVVLTSLFVPYTLLSMAAGFLFGLIKGSLIMVLAALITAALNFIAARTLLRPQVETIIGNHPKMIAIQRTAEKAGLRLQLLIRFSPLNPVSVSYVLGISRIPFSTFMLGCLGLIPGIIMEVYFGYLSQHLTKVAGGEHRHTWTHTIIVTAGFAFSILLVIWIGRMASREMANMEIVEDSETLR